MKKFIKMRLTFGKATLANESLIAIHRQFKSYFRDKKVIDLGCGDSIFLKKNGVHVT
ncbi:hypothetical protein [Campylobacter vulpis]|uniref:hypothetical protein n=1 Tax=Campylobacter vulpis TaxID=1655500 RepID=UPI00223E9457|nr:hypothetical protein [Campylobacter vulpis]